jgi:uncharacterized protein (TIGR02391 family)
MPSIPTIPGAALEAISQVLGDTSEGLTGSEIAELLSRTGLPDPGPVTKWRRIYEPLLAGQDRDHAGNVVGIFIEAAMAPVRFTGRPHVFEARRRLLNERLAFVGLDLGDDGKLRTGEAASTISEAKRRADKLRAELVRRHLHPDVLRACREELLEDENLFHAVLEATKSVAHKLREKAALDLDGNTLVDRALMPGKSGTPVVGFNSLTTETLRSEHRGITDLMRGMFKTFRNPTAHEPKAVFKVSEEDAWDLLSLCSLLHRRLDLAVRTAPFAGGSP